MFLRTDDFELMEQSTSGLRCSATDHWWFYRKQCLGCRVFDIIPGMNTPQAGIFALGTSSHAYLEFDLLDSKRCKEFASTIAAIREPRTTTGGVNFVIGFRPELWREDGSGGRAGRRGGVQQGDRGHRGIRDASTQHDALVWLSGSAYDVSSIWRALWCMTSQDKRR